MTNRPSSSETQTTKDSSDHKIMSDPAGLTPVIYFGTIIIGIFFLGFGGWASFASLNSAVIASGITVVESNHKYIQHYEGGIVGQILVKDGDLVNKGQILLRLDETQPKSRLDMAKTRLMFASAVEARLIAEFQQKNPFTILIGSRTHLPAKPK